MLKAAVLILLEKNFYWTDFNAVSLNLSDFDSQQFLKLTACALESVIKKKKLSTAWVEMG